MEVDQLEDVEAALITKPVDELHKLRSAQSELGFFAAALCPAPRSLGVKLDSHAGSRRNAELVSDLKQNVHLAQLFQHDEDLVAELLSHEREAHELLVLIPVAHDH